MNTIKITTLHSSTYPLFSSTNNLIKHALVSLTAALIFNNTDDDGNYTVPGFVYGCYLFQTVLQSSLSCLYSPTSIAELRQQLDLRDENLEDYLTETGFPLKLNATATRFSVEDTIETLAYAMFIESWSSNISYERYFNSCAPNSCTYIYHYRFDALALFTTFLSVFKGFSLAFRFLVPRGIQLFRKMRARFRISPLQ